VSSAGRFVGVLHSEHVSATSRRSHRGTGESLAIFIARRRSAGGEHAADYVRRTGPITLDCRIIEDNTNRSTSLSYEDTTIKMNAAHKLDRVRQAFDANWSRIYRDEMDTLVAANKSGSYRHFGGIVEQLSSSFGRPIVALDLGCGTGRHFNLLRNVERLVAIDLSEHMVEQARNPIFADKITVGSIEYLVGDIYSGALTEATFDLIYCIGVVGEYVPVDAVFLRRLYALLRPGGLAFFTATDSRSRVSVPENARPSFVRRALCKGFPLLPARARELLNLYFSPSYTTPARMENLLRASPFFRHSLVPYVHTSGWRGTSLQCTVWRGDDSGKAAD
jgi:SAM-dependent methyltransferase